ncbi:MAG TPA: hypothetical protein VFX98_07170 [Longimicrobiaceae bacterium]|nr:hypothetical protein [Longimicrobiaceae bacterium]
MDRGLVSALVAAAVTAACASSGGGGGGPAPRANAGTLPQVACTGATATPQALAAKGALDRSYIVQGDAKTPFFQTALQQAQAGIQADPQNPHHHFLAAEAQLGLNDLAGADASLDRVVQLCPEYAAEVAPVRDQGWATAFQAGLDAYGQGDTTRAIAAWESAAAFDDKRIDTFYNLAVVHGQRGDVEASVRNYRRVLETMETAPADTGTAAAERAEMRANALAGMVSAGATLFGQDEFQESGELFALVTRVDPNNRDAWYNHALALYKLSRWQELVPVATRLVQIDPLNYNGRIILFNAYKGLSDAAKASGQTAVETTNRNLALRTLEEADALPVHVEQVTIANSESGARLNGTVKGAAAAAGTPVQLEFTFFGPAGEVGRQTVTVSAPVKDQTASFEVSLETGPVTAYAYRVVR